jgi:chitosanase
MKRTARLSRRGAVVLVVIALVLLGAGAVAVVTRPSPDDSEAADPRDPRLSLIADAGRKQRAAQITSTFENSTLELQYGYVENIGDGRGVTAGRAGFTSATGDLLLVLRRYTQAKPGNILAPYIPPLEAVNGTDSVQGLDSFADAWAEAAADPDFRGLQDELVDELYFFPAMTMAGKVGIVTPLGQMIMWDAMIQHGAGGDNGTRAIIKETQRNKGTIGQDESAWLDAFLDVRLRHLVDMYRGTTENADVSSESRVEALR